jgi:SUMO ligase MMS21 Smc5/6 complex component
VYLFVFVVDDVDVPSPITDGRTEECDASRRHVMVLFVHDEILDARCKMHD